MYVFTPAIDLDDFIFGFLFIAGLILFFVALGWIGGQLGEWTAERDFKERNERNKHE